MTATTAVAATTRLTAVQARGACCHDLLDGVRKVTPSSDSFSASSTAGVSVSWLFMLHLPDLFGDETTAQRRHRARQVGSNGSPDHPERLGRGLRVEIEEDLEHDHLPLPLRQLTQACA